MVEGGCGLVDGERGVEGGLREVCSGRVFWEGTLGSVQGGVQGSVQEGV